MSARRSAAASKNPEEDLEELEKTDDEVHLETGWSDDSVSPRGAISRRSSRGRGGGGRTGGGAGEEEDDSSDADEAETPSDDGDRDWEPEPSATQRKAVHQLSQGTRAGLPVFGSDVARRRFDKPLERRRRLDTEEGGKPNHLRALLQSSAAVRRDRNPPYAYPVLHPPAEHHEAAASSSLPVHKKNKGAASKRYLMALPGSFAPVAGGEIGTVEKLDSLTPELVLDWPHQGKLRLRGTMAYPKSRYLVLQRKGLQMQCEDELDQLLLFSEVKWQDGAGEVAGTSSAAPSSSCEIPASVTTRLHKGISVGSDNLERRRALLRSAEHHPLDADGAMPCASSTPSENAVGNICRSGSNHDAGGSRGNRHRGEVLFANTPRAREAALQAGGSNIGVHPAGASCSRPRGSKGTSGNPRFMGAPGGVDTSPTSPVEEDAHIGTPSSASAATGAKAVRASASASSKRSSTHAAAKSKIASRPLEPAGNKPRLGKGTPKRSRPSTDDSSDGGSASEDARNMACSAVSSSERTPRSRRLAGTTPKSYVEDSEEDSES